MAKKPTNSTNPIHKSYIRNIPNQEDVTSGRAGERVSEQRAGERVTKTEAEQPTTSGRESDEGRPSGSKRQAQVGELEDSKYEELKSRL
jgi:hypothetical protein